MFGFVLTKIIDWPYIIFQPTLAYRKCWQVALSFNFCPKWELSNALTGLRLQDIHSGFSLRIRLVVNMNNDNKKKMNNKICGRRAQISLSFCALTNFGVFSLGLYSFWVLLPFVLIAVTYYLSWRFYCTLSDTSHSSGQFISCAAALSEQIDWIYCLKPTGLVRP